jgi:alpha-D-xyloside xylohydrolase
MKFTNGFFLMRDGIEIFHPMEIRDIQIGKNSITAYAACREIKHRYDTLDVPMITINFSSPLKDVICVRLEHFKGKINPGPEFQINVDVDVRADVLVGEKEAKLSSGNLSVSIGKQGRWKADFLYKGRYITGSGHKNVGYIIDRNKNVFMREQLGLGVGEYVYGMGERFTPFVRNGQSVDIWNADGGTCTERAYKNVPFYISNKGYGVFVNHPECVSFEVASENVSRVQFSVPGEYLEYYVIGGSTLKDVLNNYTILTGRPALPPAWSFGLWLSTSFTTNYDECTVNSFIDGMKARGLPLHVFHFDCFWMKEFQWCNFEWDKDVFPYPEEMLERLKSKGLKICIWINPYIAQKSPLFDEGMENGYLVKLRDGSVWQWDRWQSGMGLVDFTNPSAVNWYKSKLKRLLDMGIDCFKTDFGERIPTEGIVYFDGSDPMRMHNYYTYLYNKYVFELLQEIRGKNQAVLFARSATAGSQQFPVHWGGDCTATYESMAETLRGGLSLGLCGFGFWSHDIGGFERTASADIYKRWIAFGLLSSHSRLHGNESYRVPWLFDEESVDVLRYFTKLKCSLMPYLFSKACEASQTGIPLMRAMVLEFNEDPTCSWLDRQYMLGDNILVAPVFDGEGTASYYLPKGIWTNFLTGEKVEGGQWRNEHHGYMSIPMMVRPNSIIAVGNVDTRPDYDYAEGVTLYIYELQECCPASAIVYNIDGIPELEVTALRDGQSIKVQANGVAKNWSLYLVGIHKVNSVDAASYENEILGIRVTPYPGSQTLSISC